MLFLLRAFPIYLSRWAYLGDYSTEIVGISSYVEEHFVEPIPDVWESSWAHTKGKKGKKGRWWDEDMTDPTPRPEPEPLSGTKGGPSEETIQDADKVNEIQASGSRIETTTRIHPLFLHIQLYVFANVYLMSSLKEISKHKIIAYLKKVENSYSMGPYTNAFFDLLDCASSYLPDSDPLLDWLARYASWKLALLRQESERLENLVRKADGKFAGLLVRHVVPSQRSPFVSPS